MKGEARTAAQRPSRTRSAMAEQPTQQGRELSGHAPAATRASMNFGESAATSREAPSTRELQERLKTDEAGVNSHGCRDNDRGDSLLKAAPSPWVAGRGSRNPPPARPGGAFPQGSPCHPERGRRSSPQTGGRETGIDTPPQQRSQVVRAGGGQPSCHEEGRYHNVSSLTYSSAELGPTAAAAAPSSHNLFAPHSFLLLPLQQR